MLLGLAGLLLQLHIAEPRAGPTELTGRWLFHRGTDARWAEPAFDDAGWDSVVVPGSWSPPVPRGYHGYAWYRLHVTFGAPVSQPLGLWFRSVATAFDVYVDGTRLGGLGSFPPTYRARTVVPLVVAIPPENQAPGPHVIALRVYSAENVGGIVSLVTVGPLPVLLASSARPDLYLASAAVLVFGLGMIELFFWVRRPHAREHGAIFALCACLALFFVWWMPSVRVALAPYYNWYRLYLACAAASAAAYCYAFRRIFDLDRHDRVVRGLALVFLVQVPLYLGVPGWTAVRELASWVLNPTLVIGSAVTLALVAIQRRHGAHHARILLWGTLLLAATLFLGIIIDWGLLAIQPTFPWAILVGAVGFVASLALTTAERFVESESAALYDRLTGLYRREVVIDALAREIRRSARTRQPVSVIMLDVDQFKEVNDTLGHQSGDRVLAEIGRRIVEAGRAVDWLGRYGGEEFVGVLTATDRNGGVNAAERIRNAVAALPIATGRTARTVTLSAGVAAYDGGEEWPTTEQLLGAADAALYRAKHAGRNRVVS